MKIAGRKNDGAWFRMNKKIKALSGVGQNGQANLVSALKEIDSFPAFIDALTDILDKTGAGDDEVTLTVDHLAEVYATVGIPRYVWLGLLAFDTYTKVAGKYKPDHAAAIRTFASDLRSVVTKFFLGNRLLLDTLNSLGADQGNPGGVADDDKTT